MEGTAGGVVRMGYSALSSKELAAWVAGSCAAQGVPVKVTDPTVVRRMAALLGAGSGGVRGAPHGGVAQPSGLDLVAPDDPDASGIDATTARGAGPDDDVVDQGGDDRVLPGQVQRGPGAA